jgi:hypothetical protein
MPGPSRARLMWVTHGGLSLCQLDLHSSCCDPGRYSEGPNVNANLLERDRAPYAPKGRGVDTSPIGPRATPDQCSFSCLARATCCAHPAAPGRRYSGPCHPGASSPRMHLQRPTWDPLSLFSCCCRWQVLTTGGWGKPSRYWGSGCRTQWGPSGLASGSPIRTHLPIQVQGPGMGATSISPAF